LRSVRRTLIRCCAVRVWSRADREVSRLACRDLTEWSDWGGCEGAVNCKTQKRNRKATCLVGAACR
jgi:hypothetical protein